MSNVRMKSTEQFSLALYPYFCLLFPTKCIDTGRYRRTMLSSKLFSPLRSQFVSSIILLLRDLSMRSKSADQNSTTIDQEGRKFHFGQIIVWYGILHIPKMPCIHCRKTYFEVHSFWRLAIFNIDVSLFVSTVILLLLPRSSQRS